MTFKLLASLALLAAPSASAFVMPKTHQTAVRLSSAVGDDDPFSKMKDKISKVDMDDLLSKVPDVSALSSMDFNTVKDNILEGNVGERGEGYAAAQFLLLGCILIGGVPIVGDFLMVLLGPCLLLAGGAAVLVSIKDLGSSLSPWAVPAKGANLVDDGIYAQLRHPLYAGLLASLAGFSIMTGSANRLLLTALLFYAFNLMADYEEEELMKKFPDYDFYKNKVTGKFFPEELTKQLPWMK